MDSKKGASLLSFLNVLSSDLGLEDFKSLSDAQQILPTFTEFVKNGQLRFMDSPNFSIRNAFDDIAKATGQQQLSTSLHLGNVGGGPSSAEAAEGNEVEVAKTFLALIFALRILHAAQFNALMQRCDRARTLEEMVNSLYARRRSAELPFTQILSPHSAENGGPRKKLSAIAFTSLQNNNLQVFSTPTKNGGAGGMDGSSPSASPGKLSADEEEMAKHKILSTELSARLKQMEMTKAKLDDQLNRAQADYSDLELKCDSLCNNNARLQDTVHFLDQKLKDSQDEAEQRRYENLQLESKLKSVNERCTKDKDRHAKEVKDREKELQLLHMRLDEFAKQVAAGESMESRLKFLDQQMSNQQGIQCELREELERALNRANIAETELTTLKKQLRNSATAATKMTTSVPTMSNGQIDNGIHHEIGIHNETVPPIESSSAVSLHDELMNSTPFPRSSTPLRHSSSVGLDSDSLLHKNFEQHMNNINRNSSENVLTDDELARLRTRLEVLECENRHLKQSIDNATAEMSRIRDSSAQSVSEKAVEIGRLKHECDTLREELQKLRQKDDMAVEKHKSMEAEANRWANKAHELEGSLDKASRVIEQYSTASDKHCSAAELLQVQHELAKAQSDNEQLRNKMDQFKHQATQEQRLITSHWFSTQIDLTKARELLRTLGLGGASSTSMTTSSTSFDNNNSSHQHATNAAKGGAGGGFITRSFLRRQLDTTPGPIAAVAAHAHTMSPLPPSSVTTFQPARWRCFKLWLLFLCITLLLCWITGLEIEINYDQNVNE